MRRGNERECGLIELVRLRVSRMRCTADPGPPWTGTVHASRVYPTCAHWAPISGKPRDRCLQNNRKKQESDQPARRSRLWKPHPEEARSAVSKDEAGIALMLRDASQRGSAVEAAALAVRCDAMLLSMRATVSCAFWPNEPKY